jgi:hypothetical protein
LISPLSFFESRLIKVADINVIYDLCSIAFLKQERVGTKSLTYYKRGSYESKAYHLIFILKPSSYGNI